MKRLIIATALVTATVFSFGQPATINTDVAKGVLPGGPVVKGAWPGGWRNTIELPEMDELLQTVAKGVLPGAPRA